MNYIQVVQTDNEISTWMYKEIDRQLTSHTHIELLNSEGKDGWVFIGVYHENYTFGKLISMRYKASVIETSE
jgi:hypothetical protein